MLSSRYLRASAAFSLLATTLAAVACGSGDETSTNGAAAGTSGKGLGGSAGAGGRDQTGSGGTKDGTGTGGASTSSGGASTGTGGASTGMGGSLGVGGSVTTGGEVCSNGLDDNANGEVDEGCPCSVGAAQACFLGDPKLAGVGTCAKGTQTCESAGAGEFKGGKWGPCRSSVAPVAEVCGNAKDDDCDGAVDDGCPCTEGSTVPCQSICGKGVQACAGGKLGACDAPLPVDEIPGNLKDDDCDGTIDETASACVAGAKEACTTACGSGNRVCFGGAFGPCDAPQPTKEVAANGKDDDCDGTIDEVCEKDATEACKTACGTGTRTCVNGAWSACSAKSPAAETCNGTDDDCDGTVDNVLGVGGACCPPGIVCGTGTCKAGVLACAAATPGAPSCQGAVGPVDEVCGNGLDDDCDGTADEGCPCSAADQPVACSTACGSGTQTCVGGTLSACSAKAPGVEVCNGEDDDCNGTVDDLPGKGDACCPAGVACGTGACTNGTRQCVTGNPALACAGGVGPTTETCNGIDDDCDGAVDAALCCGSGAPCSTGLPGVCSAGLTGCTGQCVPNTPAGPEVCGNGVDDDCDGASDEGCCVATTETCNGADDDCDGQIDEGCACVNGQTQPCGFGCGNGTQTCVSGAWTTCNAKQPSPETCNNVDDDCDGLVDEDGVCCSLPAGTPCTVVGQVGACASGGWICPPGERLTGSCQQTTGPTSESCNGRDDDCNGVTDDPPVCCAAQTGQSCATGQAGICAAGTVQCNGQCVRNQDPRGEVCGNGVDEDCSGADLACSLPAGSCNYSACDYIHCNNRPSLDGIDVSGRDCQLYNNGPGCGCGNGGSCTVLFRCRCSADYSQCAPACGEFPYTGIAGSVSNMVVPEFPECGF